MTDLSLTEIEGKFMAIFTVVVRAGSPSGSLSYPSAMANRQAFRRLKKRGLIYRSSKHPARYKLTEHGLAYCALIDGGTEL